MGAFRTVSLWIRLGRRKAVLGKASHELAHLPAICPGLDIMFELIIILAAIALFDSLSMVPLVLVPMTVALGGVRPLRLAAAFVAGVFVAYLLCGLPLLVGVEVFFDWFGAYLNRLWNRPNGVELAVQIGIGLLLILSAWYLWRRSGKSKPQADAGPSASGGALFFLGASLVVVGMPGAVPYLAAIERIVTHGTGWVGAVGLLVLYNCIFVVPMILLIALRYLLSDRAEAWFQALAKFCLAVMPRLTSVLFLIVGVILVADGIGWFLGRPLLPVSPSE